MHSVENTHESSVTRSSEDPFDDKAHIRDELNLDGAQWRRPSVDFESDNQVEQPADTTEENSVEFAFVPHSDGLTYVAMRQSSKPDGDVLIFTPTEWIAFIEGVKDNEFDWE